MGASSKSISVATYVFAACPYCDQKDWATERRFLGVLGPRSFYGVLLAVATIFVGLVIYLGFFFNP
jgi:hypothetical protein